jgi:hypothetical protein
MAKVLWQIFVVLSRLDLYLATDLYSWTAAQTFTVGQPHPTVNARSSSTPVDIAWADPNDCSIGPLGGVGNFINYDTN